jgi:hypothetical protein
MRGWLSSISEGLETPNADACVSKPREVVQGLVICPQASSPTMLPDSWFGLVGVGFCFVCGYSQWGLGRPRKAGACRGVGQAAMVCVTCEFDVCRSYGLNHEPERNKGN